MQSSPFLRIGSRGSNLALVQARLVQRLLSEAHGVPLEAIDQRDTTVVIRGLRAAASYFHLRFGSIRDLGGGRRRS